MSNIEESPVVWIHPIVTHLKNGQDVAEVGIDGDANDLEGEEAPENLDREELETPVSL